MIIRKGKSILYIDIFVDSPIFFRSDLLWLEFFHGSNSTY